MGFVCVRLFCRIKVAVGCVDGSGSFKDHALLAHSELIIQIIPDKMSRVTLCHQATF